MPLKFAPRRLLVLLASALISLSAGSALTLHPAADEGPTPVGTPAIARTAAGPAAPPTAGPTIDPAVYFTPTLNPTPTAVGQGTREKFSGEVAFGYVSGQVDYGFRPTGSTASYRLGDYILETLRAYGWNATEQGVTIQINDTLIKGRNLIGSIGSGPVIILAAHYDTRLWADQDPDPARHKDPVMGANDAGSGVAVLLELARVLGKGYTFNHEIRLVFLDAEDNGDIPGWNIFSIGTYQYVKALDVKPAYAIILDMIGDANQNIYFEGQSMRSAPELMTGIWKVAASLGYADSFIASPKYTMIDDHVPFIEAGIKAIDIIDFDYPPWHTVSDTLDKVSARSLERVGRTLQAYLESTGVIQ
jgi:hypothetical protein